MDLGTHMLAKPSREHLGLRGCRLPLVINFQLMFHKPAAEVHHHPLTDERMCEPSTGPQRRDTVWQLRGDTDAAAMGGQEDGNARKGGSGH